MALSYHRTFGLNVTISRSTNNYGPRQSKRALIARTIDNFINNKEITIYGSGKHIRDWVYVRDHVAAIDLILHNGKTGKIYNISGETKKTNLEVIKIILNMLNKSESFITYGKDRLGHDLKYSIDSSKIINELGWKREYSFEEGIKNTINSILNK